MIIHAAEIWLALFVAFAVGSLIGWLVYRWVDRSDYAFDQRELSNALGRRLSGRDPAEDGDDDMPPPGQLRLPPPRSRTAERFRAKVRSSVQAAAWRESRDPNAEEVVAAPASKIEPKPEPEPPPRPDRSMPPPRRLDRPALASRAAPRPAEPTRDDEDEDDPWRRPGDAWPVRHPVWPTVRSGGGQLALPSPNSATKAPVLAPSPSPDDIWSEVAARPADKRVLARKQDSSAPRRPVDADIEAAATMLSPGDDKDRPPALSERPAKPDDLRAIKGIGPAFEKRLNQLGIYRYRQIAAWTPAERDWVSHAFGAAARIEKDDWIGQAVELCEPGARTATDQDPRPE